MTGRERLIAASRGGSLDRTPVLAWGSRSEHVDGWIVEADELGSALDRSEGKAVLVAVASPLCRALERSMNLTQTLHDSPAEGEKDLEELILETRSAIALTLDHGADGIAYRLEGACPSVSTPMQYGGHYLEADREILQEFASAPFNLLHVGGEEPYLDFVIDLPAHAFSWDLDRSPADPAQIRRERGGAIAVLSRDADIICIPSHADADAWAAIPEAVN